MQIGRMNHVLCVCNKMVILIVLLAVLATAQGHLIISVTPANGQVNANQQLTIKILTTAPVPPNSLQFNLTADFTLSQPCALNGTSTACTLSSSTSSVAALFATALANNTYYLLTLNATNPPFAANFPITAAVSSTPFANQGVFTVTPKTISCTMTSSSAFVGDTAVGYFALNNDPLPAGAIITINSSLQTTFNNLFAPSPLCQFSTGSAPCSLSTSFSEQLLTITGVPSSAGLSFNVSQVNNSPYNASLMTVSLQIQNANSYYMQVCSFAQPAPTQLRTSTSASLQNWNNSVGAISNSTLTINTYFTPFTTSSLAIYDSNLTAIPYLPTVQVQLVQQGNNTLNYLTAGTQIGRSLSFYLTITNPPTLQPLLFTLYVIYSTSLFVQTYNATFALAPLNLILALNIVDSRTMTVSKYNCSTSLPFPLPNATITLTLTAGTFQCTSLVFTSNAPLTLYTCSNNTITLTGATPSGTLWMSFSVANYFSVRSDNYLAINITGPAPSYYAVGTATAKVTLTPDNQTFTINNYNTTFNAPTHFTIAEASVTITNGNLRIFTITLPQDLQISAATAVVSANSATTLTNYSITANIILLSLYGPLNINLTNLTNPVKYLGSTLWTITATDNANNPSSAGSATHTPFYTPTIASASILLSNSVIEAQATLTLTVIPSLQYYFTPNITVTVPNSVLQTVCSTCTLQSASVFTFAYFAAVMKVNITVKNSLNPNNNSLSLTIATSNTTFETLTLNYSLNPMTYTYSAYQTGFFGQLGTVNITLTSGPTTPTLLTYSSLTPILSSPSCTLCNNSQIIAQGIVQYFQTSTITLTGTSNGITYATANVPVTYICASIQGCRICANQSGTLACQQCFTSDYTPYCLLYNAQCLQSCPIGTYSNSLTCAQCNTNCQTCDASSCYLCTLNYFVYNGTCLTVCPAPLVNNATHCISVPIVCPNHCANCPASYQCLACDGGYLLLNNLCYSSCPASYTPNSQSTACVLFIPPQETSYFPFPFAISAVLLTIALISIKCYDKRSLVMGNLIAFLALVEIGSMIMTLVYSLQTSSDLLTQALCFILLLSKLTLNLIFLAYFCKAIATEPDFQRWRQQDEAHERLYRTLVALSSAFSFQTIRIIYSRLLGLRIFFGKFNTALIFKPLNFFTLAHFATSGFALVFLSVRNIIAANGYRTSAFYSSIESIILETLLLITCIIDNKKGYDDEFFEYQVYKVRNQYESSHIEPVEIEEQAENVCSMHEMLNAVQGSSGSPRKGKSALIVRNQMWVKRQEEPRHSFQDMEVQSDVIEEEANSKEGFIHNGKNNSEALLLQSKQDFNQKIDETKQSIFRRKIVQDWRNLQKTLPHNLALLRNRRKEKQPEQAERNWVSPNEKRKIDKSIKRASSVEQMQIELPQNQSSIPEKIKQYFLNRSSYLKPSEALKKAPTFSQKRKRRQRKLNKDGIFIQEQAQSNQQQNELDHMPEQKSATMELQRQIISLSPRSNSKEEAQQKVEKDQDWSANQERTYADSAVGPNQRYRVQSRNPNAKQQLNQLQQHYEQNEDQFEQSSQDNGQLQLRGNQSQKRFNHKQQTPLGNELAEKDIKLQYQSNPRLKPKLPPGYKCDDGDIKEKKYRTKKRRVNRLTEEVYLQRLFGSSQKKARHPKSRKIDF